MPYIFVSRARDRVVYLLDVFHDFGARGIEALFDPAVYARLQRHSGAASTPRHTPTRVAYDAL